MEKVLKRYRERNRSIPILVEGRKDTMSLRLLDFTGEIKVINTGNSLLAFSENISRNYREVILLMDFDEKGIELEKQIEAYLKSLHCYPDTFLWNYLRRYLPVNTVEDLPVAVSRVMESG
ncbi:MAG: hypothetical protein QXV22_00975 [Thermoplasmataceae archaeon]